MVSITKNQLIVGEYVVLTHESANRNCELYPLRIAAVGNSNVNLVNSNGGTLIVDLKRVAFCGALGFIHGIIISELAGIVGKYLSTEQTDREIKEKVEKYVD